MCANGWNGNVPSSSVALQLYNFETLTHGFGIATLLSSMATFRTFLMRLGDDSKVDE